MTDFDFGSGPGGGGHDRSFRPRRANKFPRFGKPKRVQIPEQPLDYKNIEYLAKFLTPQGKIQSRKRTGFSGQDQRKLALAIKRARFLGLLPYVAVRGG